MSASPVRPNTPRTNDALTPQPRQSGVQLLFTRLERALDDDVKLLALTIDERAIILAALEDPPRGAGRTTRSTAGRARMEKRTGSTPEERKWRSERPRR